MPPYICTPPVHSYAPWGCKHPHMSSILLSASVCSERHLHVVGGCRGPLHVGHLPYMLDTSPIWGCLFICLTPTHCLASLWISMLRGYLHVIWGIFPLMLGVWGCSPYVGDLRASAHLSSFGVWKYMHWVSIMLYLVPFLQFIMSHISTTAMTTTLPVMMMSSGLSTISSVTMAPSLMGLPATLGQHEVVLPPHLMPRCLGDVTGLASVPHQQPPSLMPLLAYASYAMGSPWVGFFFRVEPPTVLFLYVWCPLWCLLSTFRFQVGCHIPLWGLNH